MDQSGTKIGEQIRALPEPAATWVRDFMEADLRLRQAARLLQEAIVAANGAPPIEEVVPLVEALEAELGLSGEQTLLGQWRAAVGRS